MLLLADDSTLEHLNFPSKKCIQAAPSDSRTGCKFHHLWPKLAWLREVCTVHDQGYNARHKVCVHAPAYIRTHRHTHTYTYKHTYAPIYLHKHTHTPTSIYLHTHAHLHNLHTYISPSIYVTKSCIGDC